MKTKKKTLKDLESEESKRLKAQERELIKRGILTRPLIWDKP